MKFKHISWLGAFLLIPVSASDVEAHVSKWSPTLSASPASGDVESSPSVAQVSSCVQMILDGFDEAHTSGIKVELESTTVSLDDRSKTLWTVRFDSGRFHSIVSSEIMPGVVNVSAEAIYIGNLIYNRVQDISNEWFVVESPATLPQLQEQFAQFQNPEGISNCQVIGATTIDGIKTTLIEFDDREAYSSDEEDYSEVYEHQVRLWLRTDGLPHRAEAISTGLIEDAGEQFEIAEESVLTYDYGADFEIVPPI